MNRDEIIQRLTSGDAQLRGMGVSFLAVFGSAGRNEAGVQSDVDLLIDFDRPVGLIQFYEVQAFIESLLENQRVDLVLRNAVLDELRDRIFAEAVPCIEPLGISESGIS